MHRHVVTILSAAALLAPLAVAAPGHATSEPPGMRDRLDVYTGVVDQSRLDELIDLGVDRRELTVTRVRGAAGRVRVEAILSGTQAEKLAAEGLELEPKLVDGDTVAQRATSLAEEPGVFRMYAGEGGLPFEGLSAEFGGPAVANNPIDEVGAFTVTSDTLPVEDFPQFASRPGAEYAGAAGPFIPIEGRYGAAALHADDSYMRLTRTYDLTGLSAADMPTFEAQFSWDTEEGYDHVLVESHTAGQDDWTTLPDISGGTSATVPVECEVGFLLDEHPWLGHYLTAGDPCQPQGTTGQWNSFTGSSDGWEPVAFDLSAYAGSQVEISVTYVTDPFTGGTGVILDDTRLRTAGSVRDAEGFEAGLGAWSVTGPPAESPEGGGSFERSQALGGITAATLTDDTVLLGFGLEQLATNAERAEFLRAAFQHLQAVELDNVLGQLEDLDDLVVQLRAADRISAFTAAGLHDRIEHAVETASEGRESLPIGYLEQLIARVNNQIRNDADARQDLISLTEAIIRDLAAISTAEDIPPQE